MNINKVTITGTIIVILLLLTLPTIYKVIKNHHDHLYEVVESKIISKAEECFYDEICTDEKITLKYLYDHNYLNAMSDPVTKEYYNEKSYVLRNNTDFKFIVVE